MKRVGGIFALAVLIVGSVSTLPAGAKAAKTSFALAGEARALELALGEQGLTLGVALAKADSRPSAEGAGAGQCNVLGDSADPDSLPCNESTMKRSNLKNPGSLDEQCAGPQIPAPLGDILDIDLACGSSHSVLKNGLPTTTNTGKVAEAELSLPIGALLPVEGTKAQVEGLIDTIVGTLQPVLDETPAIVEDAVVDLVEDVKDLLDLTRVTNAVKLQVGAAESSVAPSAGGLKVSSSAAGARLGLIGMPTLNSNGDVVGVGDPLTDGLIIIEVGSANASASVNKATADSDSAASAALVTVKVRDITNPNPTYITVNVSPETSVTLLAGTPAESTITAASATSEEGKGSARAAADAVRLHLLKGVMGGVKLGLARVTAAAAADQVLAKPPVNVPPPLQKPGSPETAARPKALPLTGGTDRTAIALLLLVAAGASFGARRTILARKR